MDVVFGKYWLSQCFDAKGEEEWVDLLSRAHLSWPLGGIVKLHLSRWSHGFYLVDL